jgi:hypothetical protein
MNNVILEAKGEVVEEEASREAVLCVEEEDVSSCYLFCRDEVMQDEREARLQKFKPCQRDNLQWFGRKAFLALRATFSGFLGII